MNGDLTGSIAARMSTVCIMILLASGCALTGGAVGRPPVGSYEPPLPESALAPDGTRASAAPYTIQLPPSMMADRGTITLWLMPQRTLHEESLEISLLDSGAFKTRLFCRGTELYVLSDYGEEMTGTDLGSRREPYRYQSLLTHLKGRRWYLAAWTWDAGDARRNAFFLNGTAQSDPSAYAYPGQLVPLAAPTSMTIGGPDLVVGGVRFYAEVLDAQRLEAMFRAGRVEPYEDEGVRFTGERFVPRDVDWDHPLYETSFENPAAELDDWRLEGGATIAMEAGNLILANSRSSSQPDPGAKHLVCWLRKAMPSDMLIEFSVCPEDRRRGLAIIFINALGVGGQDIFDPALRPRDGTFVQYTKGDINSYHISYWAGGRGTANIRKNAGFHLAAIGRDLVADAPQGAFQTIRLHKRNGHIRLMVDDVVAVSYRDDGQRYGPVHDHPGCVGLRQMAHTGRCAYGHLKIWPLK